MQFPLYSNAETPFSPVSMATGRARVATSELGLQVLSNPAALVHAPDLSVGLIYQGGREAFGERNEHNTVTVVDNGDDVFAAGGALYSSRQRSFENATDFKEQRFQMSFGWFIFKQVSMGININYFLVDSEDDDNNFLESTHRIWDGDIGFMWNPNPEFAVGATYESLTHKKSGSIPDHIEPRDRATVGVHYIFMPQFRLRADVTRLTDVGSDYDGDLDFRAGFESYVDAWLVLRAGYESQNSADRDYFSAGFGFTGPRLRIDYAYSKNTEFSDGALHSVDFRLPF